MIDKTTVEDVIVRAKDLADLPIDDLRALYPLKTDTREQLIDYCKNLRYSRGWMVEAVLAEEFLH